MKINDWVHKSTKAVVPAVEASDAVSAPAQHQQLDNVSPMVSDSSTQSLLSQKRSAEPHADAVSKSSRKLRPTDQLRRFMRPQAATSTTTQILESRHIGNNDADLDEQPDPAAVALTRKILDILIEYYPHKLVSVQLKTLFAEYEARSKELDCNSLDLLSSDIVRRWVSFAWEFVVSCMKDNRLPKFKAYDERWGLYVDILNARALADKTSTMAYGGMTACAHGFHGRIIHRHQNAAYRAKEGTLHYKMYDLPGTKSEFFVFAVYSRSDNVAKIVVGEAVMIAMLGLYENEDYYKLLKGLHVPMAMAGLHEPRVGLNADLGLRYTYGVDEDDAGCTDTCRCKSGARLRAGTSDK